MNRRLIAVVMLSLLMLNVLFALEVSPVGAAGTIYIRADGSINPPTAPISTSNDITYLLMNNTSSSIVIQRNNILFHGNGFTVQGAGNGTGIDLSAVSNVTLEDTYIVDFQYGVMLSVTSPNLVLENCLIHNQIGVCLGGSSNNTISGNNVINSTYAGILMNCSSYNVISKNNITTNYDGILVDASFNNTIVHNNFVRSTNRQVDIVYPGSGNVYDEGYPWCGNYWSDYNGTDVKSGPFQNETGSDGVGDTPYVIDSNNKDGYPLMSPWTANFTIFNHMVVGYSSGPLTLDPACAYDTASLGLITNVYETLIAFDEEKTDEFVPRLATDWYISPDSLTYTFRIRQGVKFHNGESLTVEDVEYSLERILVIDYYLGPSWMLYEALLNQTASRDRPGENFTVTGLQIDNAVTRNDTCVALHLIRPYPPLMQILASPWSSIVCKKWCTQIGDWPGTWNNWTLYNLQYSYPAKTAIDLENTNPPGPHTNAMCGTGPFMFDYYEAGVEWQLVRFDGYWGGWPASGSAGSLKRVTGKIVSDWETRKNMFLDGELDTLQVPQTGFDEVYGQPGVQCIYPLQCFLCDALFFTFNISTSSPFMGVPGGLPPGTLNESGISPDFFTDINVRKGFAYAFNYTELIAEALGGEASQPATPIIPGLPYYNSAQEKYTCNLTKAIQYFSSAWSGQLWSHGFNFTMCYNAYNVLAQVGSAVRQKACEIMKAEVESLNPKFHIQIQPLDWPDYRNNAVNSRLPIFDIGWLADFPDPDDFAEGFMYSVSPYGTFAPMQSYSNSTIDSLVEQGISTMNETARRQIYYQLQSVYHDDCPSVPTYQPLGYRFQRDWVQGWHSNTLNDEWFSIDYFYSEWKGNTSVSSRFSWDMFHHDVTHTGCGDGPAPETNRTQWDFTTGDAVASSPAVVDGRVYVGSNDHRVYCFDANNGTLLWNYTTGYLVTSSPAVCNGKVYVGSQDGLFYCLDALSGAQVWNFTAAGGSIISSPTVSDNRVYFGSTDDDDRMYCLDASTGLQIWNFTRGRSFNSSPAIYSGNVYCTSGDGNIFCLDALSGSLVWNRTIGAYVDSSPAAVNGKVYVGSDDGKLYCMNAYNGSVSWTYATGHVTSSPAVADGKVYVASLSGRLYCLDAMSGAHVWDYHAVCNFTSSPAVADGKVYVGDWNGSMSLVHCFNASTGSQVWSYGTGENVQSSPAVADGLVFIGSDNGKMYAFGNVIRVPEDYGTVQAAINAAAPGATIWIAPGVYHESIIINKTITLIGKPGSEPIFNGGGSGIAITIVSSGSGSIIAGITITSWDQGIIVQDAASCQIYDNIMSLINNNGVVLQGTGAVSNQVCGNMFEQDAVAVDVTSSSSSNVISQNIISLSSIGLRIETSGNTICENMITENQLGITIVNSNNNAIYHNDFMDNTIAFQLSASTSPGNTWDNGYPSGGNYWSTWTGPDKNSGPNQNILGVSDGIVDTPCTVAVNNKDNYPLAKPFQLHNVGIAYVALGKTVVGRGYCCNITLIIVDYGLCGETFNMAIWVSQLRIDLQQVVLADRSSTEINFTWDTTGLLYGNYTVDSVADVVPDETLTADNNYVFNVPVHVGVPGDVSGTTPGVYDGITNMKDVAYLVSLFNTKPSSPNWMPNADVNNDGLCNMKDIAVAVYFFNQRE